jgi:hypothetical protein
MINDKRLKQFSPEETCSPRKSSIDHNKQNHSLAYIIVLLSIESLTMKKKEEEIDR